MTRFERVRESGELGQLHIPNDRSADDFQCASGARSAARGWGSVHCGPGQWPSASFFASGKQVLLQGTVMRLVCVDIQAQGFIAHWQLAGDLLRAPLQLKQRTGLLFHPGRKRVDVAARPKAFAVKFTGIFSSVASTPGITTQLATTRGTVASKQQGQSA